MWNWWPFKKRQRESLYGFDLSQWNYMGYTVFTFHDPITQKTNGSATIFFFVDKTDYAIRGFHLEPKDDVYDYTKHPWFTQTVRIWAANQKDLHIVIHTSPSKWMTDYMLQQFGYGWDWDRKEWILLKGIPEGSASSGPQLLLPTSLPIIERRENNVIVVDFTKKKKNEDEATTET